MAQSIPNDPMARPAFYFGIALLGAAVFVLVSNLFSTIDRNSTKSAEKQNATQGISLAEATIEENIKPIGTVKTVDKSIVLAARSGDEVYKAVCSACHSVGVLGAPKFDSKEDWAPRVTEGLQVLLTHAINGKGSMPARGGNPSITDEELTNAILYMTKNAGFDLSAETSDDSAATDDSATQAEPTTGEKAVATTDVAPVAQTESTAQATADTPKQAEPTTEEKAVATTEVAPAAQTESTTQANADTPKQAEPTTGENATTEVAPVAQTESTAQATADTPKQAEPTTEEKAVATTEVAPVAQTESTAQATDDSATQAEPTTEEKAVATTEVAPVAQTESTAQATDDSATQAEPTTGEKAVATTEVAPVAQTESTAQATADTPKQAEPTTEEKAVAATEVAPVAQTESTAQANAETSAPVVTPQVAAINGEKVYKSICFSCHDVGVAGSPKLGDKEAWQARIATGIDTLYQAAIQGKGVMPAKGGMVNLSDDEIKAAVDYMVKKVQ